MRATTVWDFDRQACERRALEARPRPEGKGHAPGHPETDRRIVEMTRIVTARIYQDLELARFGLDNFERRVRRSGSCLPWSAPSEGHSLSSSRGLVSGRPISRDVERCAEQVEQELDRLESAEPALH